MKLEAWMDLTNVGALELAPRLGIHHTTIYRYVHKRSRPTVSVMARIVRETNGAVRPDDFYSDVISDVIEEVRSITPPKRRPRRTKAEMAAA